MEKGFKTLAEMAAEMETAVKNVTDRKAELDRAKKEYDAASFEFARANTTVIDLTEDFRKVLNAISVPPNPNVKISE